MNAGLGQGVWRHLANPSSLGETAFIWLRQRQEKVGPRPVGCEAECEPREGWFERGAIMFRGLRAKKGNGGAQTSLRVS